MTSRAHQIQGPGGKIVLAAVITVAAVYVYFLIFAQFGFLKAVQAARGAEGDVIRPIMAVMGLMGVTGSVLAACFFSENKCRHWLAAGFGFCAVAAVGSLGAKSPTGFYLVAGLTGLGVGLATVTLAGMLRRSVGDESLGKIIGLGTGLAYGICNLPGIFDASPETQAQLALAAVAAGWAGGRRLAPRFQLEQPGGGEYSPKGTAAWVVVFVALVCLDSAAFYVIQHATDLKEGMWTGTGRLMLNAGVHLGVAVLTGWALDRRWMGRTVGLGAVLLLLACWLINERHQALGWAGLFYVAGVSIYSTALVFYPARSGRPWLAALVYAVAGWGGSALGIGLAENRSELPGAVITLAAAIIALSLGGRHLMRRPEPPA